MKSSTMIASTLRTNVTRVAAAAALLLAAGASAQAAAAPQSAAPAAAVSAAASSQEQVRQLYLTLLGREPDAGGLQYWTQAVNNGYSLANVEAQIKSSPEYAKRNPGPGTIPATPNNFYV